MDEWISQFESQEDKVLAKLLVDNILAISADDFINSMYKLVNDNVTEGGVGIYIETERRNQLHKESGKRKPDRLFKRSRGKRERAVGAGPPVVKMQNNPNNEVGSEGILAQLATEIYRQNFNTVSINPGPSRIRKDGAKIHHFLLLTDFIGTGDRAYSYLESAWRLKSVRSWWSRRSWCGMKFEVLAYSATEHGLKHVQSHPCQPVVKYVATCPTIFNRFTTSKQSQIIDLCNRYTNNNVKNYSLGYGESGALIAFHHGIPNNTPSILWHKSKYWKPLFVGRVTSSLRNTFSSELHIRDRYLAILHGLGLTSSKFSCIEDMPLASVKELLVLASLRRSPRTRIAISGRSGIDLFQTQAIISSLQARRFVDDLYRLTETGKHYLYNIAIEKEKALPEFNKTQYYPSQLRAPKEPS